MKCQHQCQLEAEIQHARNAEQRHLAEIGEMARRQETQRDRINELEVIAYKLEKWILRLAKLKGSKLEDINVTH